jgi:predicted Holliday junction resolvase-like endonuclease
VKTAELLSKLTRDKRLYGTCPHCGEEFRIGNARLFSVEDGFPDDALMRIKEMKDALIERRNELKEMKHRMTNRSRVTAESVNLGKILEKIAPSFDMFQFDTHDCRSLFEPIDYIIFSGLQKAGIVDSLTFLDVKSGAARLTRGQKEIASAVEQGRIEVDVIPESRRRGDGR